MTSVSEKLARSKGRPVFICDFSPPRGSHLSAIEAVKRVGADFVCVNYSPGGSVRVESVVAAYMIAKGGDQDVVFTLATRDMNRLALGSHLLGAQLLGLENVVVVKGDCLGGRGLGAVKVVDDLRPTDLIQAVGALNQGRDFRGLRLRAPTSFCVGAVVDLNRQHLDAEARLAQRKAEAGADFFLAQPFHDMDRVRLFHEAYEEAAGQPFARPIFYGVQILATGGLAFGRVPEETRRQLEKGRPAVEVAVEQVAALAARGMTTIYLVPPVLPFGRRDYASAEEVVNAFRG